MPPEPLEPEPTGAPVPPPTRTRRGETFWRWLFVGSVVALVAVVAFGAGMLSERILFAGGGLFERARIFGGTAGDADDAAALYPRYADTRELIEDEFLFRPTEPDAQATFAAELERGALAGVAAAAATPVASFDELQRALDYGAARGATGVLDDPYTVFLEPVQQAPLAEALEGEYEGIGVWVEHPEGRFTVVAPIPGSPADEAGIRPGDVLLEADGVPLTGLSDADGLELIRGPAGTRVSLLIEREGEPAPFVVDVERQAIVIPSVVYETQADGRVAWISVAVFGDKTTAQLDEALKRARDEDVAGVVLDLRGNGGGWVTSAREMLGRFVPEDRGPALYEDSTPGDDDEPAAESIVGGGEQWFDRPLVVLVDGGSASASEIVAGALRDYGRAQLVGQPTFGKGLVQRVHDFADGSSARITFARWLTPNRLPIPEEGLRPDVAVAMPDPPDGTDPQLAAAVDAVLAGAGLPPATPPAGATPSAATPEAAPVAATPEAP